MKRKLNVKLLRKIQKHIAEEPRRFQMSSSVLRAKDQEGWRCEIMWSNDAATIMPPCGTAACIAGWADILSGGDGGNDFCRARAAKAIGVDPGDSWISHPLFYASNWPEPFASRYAKAKTPKPRAKIACERIDHLIETGE